MTTKIAAAVLLMVALDGCATERPTVVDDPLCRSRGIRPGDVAYIACLTELDRGRTGRSCFGSCH